MRPALDGRRALLAQALLALLAVLVDGLAVWALTRPVGAQAAALLWWLALPLLLGASGWLAHRIATQPAGLHGARRLAAVLLPPLLLLALIAGSLSHAGALGAQALARGGGLQPSALDGGRTLRLQGEIRPGDTAALRNPPGAETGWRRVEIDSPGGSWAEAARLAAWVRERGLATRVSGRCDGACSLVFRAGTPRQLLTGAELGLARLPVASWQPWWRAWVRAEQDRLHAGLTEDFRRRLALAAPQGWRPMRVDLVAAGVLERPDFGLDVGLPPLPGALPDEYRAALRSEPAWPALDRRFPGLIDEVAALLQAQRDSGVPDAMAAQFAQQLVIHRQTQLLASVSGESRQLYLVWLIDALDALKDEPALCSALLQGDVAARRRLPLALAAQELQWLEEAAQEPPAPRKPMNGLEREVIRRTLGDAATAQLPRLWTAGSELAPLDCASARRLVAQVQALPGPQRRLVLRRVFERA